MKIIKCVWRDEIARKGICLLATMAVLFGLAIAHAAPGTGQTDNRTTWFNCTIISTATSLAEVTGCGVLTGESYYITSIKWSSSIISTTTNFMLVQSGTGSNCASATTSHYAGFALAFTPVSESFPTPIKVTAGHALCFVHPGAGTRNVTITGYRGP